MGEANSIFPFKRAAGLALSALLGLAALAPGGSYGQDKEKKDKEPGVTRLRIEVTGGEKNQVVENASVYVRFAQGRALAKDKKVELNVKTNRDGIAKVPEIPSGKVVIQVVAEGWKPFGRWYDLEGGDQTIKIHLEKPPRWY